MLQKLQRGDCAVFQVHLGCEVDNAERGSHTHLASARKALESAELSASFFRARTYDELADPYAEPDKPDDDAMDEDGGACEESDEEEEDYDDDIDDDGMDM